MRVVAVDKDAGDNGRVSYVISSGNEEGRFSVGYDSGLVSLVRPPLLRPSELEITANDHGVPPRKASLKLSLTTAAGQTSGPPRLLLPNPIARVSENLRVGADVASVAGAAVLDQGKLNITLYLYMHRARAARSLTTLFSLERASEREHRSRVVGLMSPTEIELRNSCLMTRPSAAMISGCIC